MASILRKLQPYLDKRRPGGRESSGVTFGRPKEMHLDQQELARELVKDGKLISAVARTFNAHTATIYRVIEGQEALSRFSVPLSRTGRLGGFCDKGLFGWLVTIADSTGVSSHSPLF